MMVPVADMFNHDVHGSEASFRKHNQTGEAIFTIRASVAVKRGSEVFISYGPKCDLKFLKEYGFVPPDSPSCQEFEDQHAV
mmetsp:Transcript_34549/g.80795  ORF Transcript_34549/g.80795 Transcript_34549/m.80795 type:complete len:81 (+) Transcript_34549:113-355(+)